MKYRTLTNLMPFVILYVTKAYDVCNQLKSSALQKATFCNVKGHLSASGLWPFTLSFAAILISTALHPKREHLSLRHFYETIRLYPLMQRRIFLLRKAPFIVASCGYEKTG